MRLYGYGGRPTLPFVVTGVDWQFADEQVVDDQQIGCMQLRAIFA